MKENVDINHLYAPEIGVLKQLEYLQIVALYVQILRFIEVHALLGAGAQGAGGALASQAQALGLALPLELVFLKVIVDVFAAKGEQFVDVQFPVGEAVGKDGPQTVSRLLLHIKAHAIHHDIIHCLSPRFSIVLRSRQKFQSCRRSHPAGYAPPADPPGSGMFHHIWFDTRRSR